MNKSTRADKHHFLKWRMESMYLHRSLFATTNPTWPRSFASPNVFGRREMHFHRFFIEQEDIAIEAAVALC